MTSILDKYRSKKITRDVAAQLMQGMGIDEEKINFYLNESDKIPDEASQKPTGGQQSGRNQKQDETPADDEEDAQQAEEAQKSLGRRKKLWR